MSFEVEMPVNSVSPVVIIFEVVLWLVLLPIRILLFLLEQTGLIGKFKHPSAEEVNTFYTHASPVVLEIVVYRALVHCCISSLTEGM